MYQCLLLSAVDRVMVIPLVSSSLSESDSVAESSAIIIL